jgi:hypothetical protein
VSGPTFGLIGAGVSAPKDGWGQRQSGQRGEQPTSRPATYTGMIPPSKSIDGPKGMPGKDVEGWLGEVQEG